MEIKEEKEATYFIGSKPEHDNKTGLSHFILSTAINGKNGPEMLQLHGLLSELPEMSFTVNYEEGPGSEWQDILSNFMANDLMAIFNALGAKGGNFKNILKAGSWTKQVYAGYSPSTIPLKFRIYTQDSCGQSSAKSWLDNLTRYATICREFELEHAVDNIFGAIATANKTGSKAADIANAAQDMLIKEKKKEADTRSEDDKEFDEKMDAVSKVENQVVALNKYFDDLVVAASSSSITIKFELGYKNGEEDIMFQFTIHDVYGGTYTNGNNTNGTAKKQVGTRKLGSAKLDVGEIKNLINATKAAVIELSKDEKLFIDNIESIFAKVDGEIDNVINNINMPASDDDKGKLGKFLTTVARIINDTGNILIDKYDDKRVFGQMNRENCLGEKLWYLCIYGGVLFNAAKPFIVYVSEWSCKPSEEMVNNAHVYYDFEITCALDQVYSLTTWQNMLSV